MDNFDIVAKLHGLVCSEAGCRDLRISMTAKLAMYEIEKLRKERDEAKSKLGRIMEGLEGTCMTCEPVGVRNQQMEQQINRLRKERDEMHRDLRKAETECSMLRIECGVITAERDEARRSVCEMSLQLGQVFRRIGGKNVEVTTPEGCAEIMRWDCFKKD